MRNVSTPAKKEIFASQSSAVFLTLLKISHPDIDTIYLVNNNENVTYDGQEYSAYAFRFDPPKDIEGQNQTSRLILDNIDRTILIALREISTPLTVSACLIMVMPNWTTTKEAGWWDFELKNITYNSLQISGELSYNIILNAYLSQTSYSNIYFPGIYG